MSKEQYVSYEVAQLLKEKGFNWGCNAHWYIGEDKTFEISSSTDPINWNEVKTDLDWLSCPTQQMAIRWFWEEKGLNINAIYGDYPALKKSFWMPQIESLDGCYGVDYEDFFREYDSREECIEAALEYALRNLI